MAWSSETWVALINALAWPLLVLFLVVYFGRPLRLFIERAHEWTVKAGPGGFEATAKAAEAGALIAEATKARQEGDKSEPVKASEIAVVVGEAFQDNGRTSLTKAKVLWVDDNPSNNVHERAAMEALGIRFDLALSTAEALEALRTRRYDLVISDMGRQEEGEHRARAGYALLDTLRARGQAVPFVIYAGSRAPEHVAEARAHGALGSTNSPQELVRLVVQGLREGR